MAEKHGTVVSLNKIDRSDLGLVGGKNASLGEMIRHLKRRGIAVPGGFATTADAYRLFMELNGLIEPIRGDLDFLRREIFSRCSRSRTTGGQNLPRSLSDYEWSVVGIVNAQPRLRGRNHRTGGARLDQATAPRRTALFVFGGEGAGGSGATGLSLHFPRQPHNARDIPTRDLE